MTLVCVPAAGLILASTAVGAVSANGYDPGRKRVGG